VKKALLLSDQLRPTLHGPCILLSEPTKYVFQRLRGDPLELAAAPGFDSKAVLRHLRKRVAGVWRTRAASGSRILIHHNLEVHPLENPASS
jgi:hypothetical protein